MKKPFNPAIIENELQDTGFFRRAKTAEPTPVSPAPVELMAENRTPERAMTRTGERTVERPPARTPVRRRARRYSFEIYEDQIERVKRLALEDQLRGGTLNQSEIVRSALDHYLAKTGKSTE
jgi:hypothetical protein